MIRKNKHNDSDAYRGEKEMKTQIKVQTGEVSASITSNYDQPISDPERGQYINFLFKEMEYQPFGNNANNPIGNYTRTVLDTAITSTTRNSTSIRAINTWAERLAYLDTVSTAYAMYCCLGQWISYYFDPASQNFGINYAGRVNLTADTLNKYDKLGLLLKLHVLPKGVQKNAVNLFTWRQAGDSADSAIIGLTTLELTSITASKKLSNMIDDEITRLEDLIINDKTNNNVFANLQTSLGKQGLNWSIDLPSFPSVLSFEKEYLTLFLHTPGYHGNTGFFPDISDVYSFQSNELTPFTCAHLLSQPLYQDGGLITARQHAGTGTNYVASTNTLFGFVRVAVGSGDINKRIIGLPSWYLETDGSGKLYSPLCNIPGGRIVKGVIESQEDMLQDYLYQLYEIPALSSYRPTPKGGGK